jgi:hypothetical protein
MAEAHDIARWISQLADPDASRRTASALQLRMAASRLCLPVINEWIADLEFRELVRPHGVDESSHPSAGKSPFVVGIAVHPENFEKIRAANGSPPLADVPPDQDALEFELRLKGSDSDILSTREPGGSGAIARYLQKFGEGIQQIEVFVTDVDRATDILRTRFGLEPVYPATRAGADGARVNFFLVPAAGKKVLIELVEPAAPHKK